MDTQTGQLFVWRDELTASVYFPDGPEPSGSGYRLPILARGLPGPLRRLGEPGDNCLYCGAAYEFCWIYPKGKTGEEHSCPFCGFAWKLVEESFYDPPEVDAVNREGDQVELWARSILKLSINDSEVALDELGTHLARRYSDIYSLDWRIFELLVEDIYRKRGFHTRLTAATRDGGYDLVLVERASGERTIVELKRYAKHRKVGIRVVDRVLGVQIRTGIPRAKIVTTSKFTAGAKNAAAVCAHTSSYELDLVDGDRLLQALQVYNANLPRLSLMKRLFQP